MMIQKPLISILLPIRDNAHYLSETISSILKQTYSNLELILIEVEYIENIADMINTFNDIRIIFKEKGLTFAESLNWGLTNAKGEYLVRMDCGHIMHTRKLEIQKNIMEEHPEIVVCSTWIHLFNNNEAIRHEYVNFGDGVYTQGLYRLFKGNVIIDSTTMIRKKFLKEKNILYQEYKYVEDYKLWIEIIKKGGQIYIEPQKLIFYRNSDSTNLTNINEKASSIISLKKEILFCLLHKSEQPKVLLDSYSSLKKLKKLKLILDEDIFSFFEKILERIRLNI